jgi:probable O-glycosylation ligase (exosortase A-associated)
VRDIALSLVVATLLVLTLKHPVVGAYLWAWLSLMNPHKLTYGFAFTLPFAQVAAVVTLVAFAATKNRQRVPLTGFVMAQICLLVWMVITSFFAIADRAFVIERFIFVFKIHLMLWITWSLVMNPKQFRIFIWVVVFSVAFFGVKGGVWTITTGGGGRVWGPPGGMLQGNNELAVGLVMLTPILYFLRQTEPNRWLKWFLTFSMLTCAFSILGSQSRGALLALLAMAFFLGIKGRYPVRTSLGLIALVSAVIAFMPDTWSDRMETIATYQADGSAMSRIWTWKTLWNAAIDRPFVGVGFGADNATVFALYAPLDGDFSFFAGRVYVAHSIYFQVLGEHGFVGLALFLAMGLLTWINAGRLAKRTKDDPEFGSWLPLLMRMVQVSLIGYAVGGAFLSLAYLDLPYYIMGFVVTATALVGRRGPQRV